MQTSEIYARTHIADGDHFSESRNGTVLRKKLYLRTVITNRPRNAGTGSLLQTFMVRRIFRYTLHLYNSFQ